ncbi:MAG: ribonuclease R [Alphaproteobacteria bacterium]
MTAKKPGHGQLPTRDELLRYIEESEGKVGKRELARAFGIKGDARAELKRLLRDLEDEGALQRGGRRALHRTGALPAVCPIDIHDIDVDGELRARPVNWAGEAEPPPIIVAPAARGVPALGVGDRALARLRKLPEGGYEAQVMRLLEAKRDELLGVFERRADGGGTIRPTERRARHTVAVAATDTADAADGEIVLAELLPQRGYEARARIRERLGHMESPRAISLIAIHTHGIPTRFSEAALAEARAGRPVSLGKRADLRELPLVTIDGEDARDFDDAVFAEPDDAPDNRGGHHIVVAIADVAHYVRPGGALDRNARERGNSVYFPDRVVPMLPEALSNELCSLKPGEPRACLAVHLWLDKEGQKRRHAFVRGLMRSRARLTYNQVQAAIDGRADEAAAPLLEPVIEPLYAAFRALWAARERRGTLELDLPERKVSFKPDGTVAAIEPAPRYDSHRLIEEMMIAANVAAAETLEAKGAPCMYRVHDRPAAEKLESLRGFLREIGLKPPKREAATPHAFNEVLARAADSKNSHLVNLMILRSQAQAEYNPRNYGHFGLGLKRYAHFTSPIRRYADLLVHRALIGALGFGDDGIGTVEASGFAKLGQHVSATERRAQLAERDAMDRYATAYLAARVGATFAGRIEGVTRFGVFVTLDDTGASGLVPASTLGHGRPYHDAERHTLEIDGRHLRLGAPVRVKLAEADVVTGGLVFELVALDGKPFEPVEDSGARPRHGHLRRPGPRARGTRASKRPRS